MSLTKQQLLSIAEKETASPTNAESVIYVHKDLKEGDEITVNRKKVQIIAPSVLLFIDLEPGVNWSHKCLYILLNEDGSIQSKTEGQFPPEANNLSLLQKPDGIEEWKMLTTNQLQ